MLDHDELQTSGKCHISFSFFFLLHELSVNQWIPAMQDIGLRRLGIVKTTMLAVP